MYVRCRELRFSLALYVGRKANTYKRNYTVKDQIYSPHSEQKNAFWSPSKAYMMLEQSELAKSSGYLCSAKWELGVFPYLTQE